MKKLFLGLLLALLFVGVQTTDIQAAGTDKASAEEITHDTLYENSYVENGEHWYTFTTVDYINYYELHMTFEGPQYSKVQYTVYDEDNTKLASKTIGHFDESLSINVKLEPNTKYYLKVVNEKNGGSKVCGDATFKLIPHADVADVKEDAQVVEFNKLYEDTICVEGVDVDWYKIETGNYYRTYNVLVNFEQSYHCRVNCKLLDGEGNKVKSNDVYSGSKVEYSINLLPNQIFYINVSGAEGLHSIKINESDIYNGWYEGVTSDNSKKSFWYEGGLRQGTYEDPKGVLGDGTVRGREIYDPESDGWYWLDSCYEGAKATSKEVWMPYIYQNEAGWEDDEINMNAAASGDMADQVVHAIKNGLGKWVRYDANGKMYKGWYTHTNKNKYYYDPKTGLMAKGNVNIDGRDYYFDPITGVLQ